MNAARVDSVLFAFKVGDPEPRSPHDGNTMVVRRQAWFRYHFGVENAGKRVYIFFCWNDTKRPALKGPWTGVRSVYLY